MKFLGDVFLDKAYKVDIDLDDFIFNLEYPLSISGEPAKNKINLGADKPNILETFGKLPKAVNLANNHIMDYGEEGYSKTINYLEQNNIGYFGAGNTKNNFNNPLVLNFNDKRVALFGYSCASTHAVFGNERLNGSALLEKKLIIKDIENYKHNVDLIVINLHWGDEEIKYPKANDIDIAHSLIDAGADLIVGHHAHVIQSIEKYKGKYIFYGIGNFIFPDFNVPSSYNGKKFLNRSSKKQLASNKEAIVVDVNKNLDISFETAIFKNNTVIYNKISIPKWLPDTQKKYELYKKIWTKKRMLGIFLRNPRIPSFNQIKLLLSIK